MLLENKMDVIMAAEVSADTIIQKLGKKSRKGQKAKTVCDICTEFNTLSTKILQQ